MLTNFSACEWTENFPALKPVTETKFQFLPNHDNHQCPSTFISSNRLSTEHAPHSHIQKLYMNFQKVSPIGGYIRKRYPLLGKHSSVPSWMPQHYKDRLDSSSHHLLIVIYYLMHTLGLHLCIYLSPKHLCSTVPPATRFIVLHPKNHIFHLHICLLSIHSMNNETQYFQIKALSLLSFLLFYFWLPYIKPVSKPRD